MQIYGLACCWGIANLRYLLFLPKIDEMKKKSKKKSGFVKKLRNLFALLMLLAACGFYVAEELGVDVQALAENAVDKVQLKPVGKLEIPVLEKDMPSQILEYKGFAVSYNKNLRLPNWVAYELTASEVEGDLPRKDKFRPDPAAAGPQANKEDYKNSGWDRGHMAPAADMKWSMVAMEESCYFTNICPQNPQLNGGDWKELEEQCRKWAQKYGSIYIACGPIVTKNEHGKIGANKVVVPDKFYKVVLAKVNGVYQGVGFIFHNSPLRKSKISGKPPVDRPLKSYAVTIDEVEAATGIDFFPALDAATQNRVESSKVMF